MSDPAEIIAATYAKEKRIRELRANPRDNRKEIDQLVASVRKDYRDVLVRTPGFTSDKVKDIIGNLWKTCFYKTIEEFRTAIKQLKKVLDSQMASMRCYVQRDKDRFAMISKEFLRFLEDSMRFFTELLAEVEKVAGKMEGQAKKEVYPHCVNIVYGCLLYLGDLARYKALHSEKPDEFTESMNYYERAALTLPFAGNAHNQLAMLATYSEAESTAVFYYCRSILAQNPFSGGLQNLAKLFSLNMETHRNLQREVRTDATLRFKLFLSSFVRLCGLLFAWTIQMHADYLSILAARAELAHLPRSSSPLLLLSLPNSSPPSSSNMTTTLQEQTQLIHELHLILQDSVLKSSKTIQVEDFHELLDFLTKELDSFLPHSKMTELRLLRLMATLIFFVHFAESPERLGQGAANQAEESDPVRADASPPLPPSHASSSALPWLLQSSSLEEKSPEAQLTLSEQQDVQQRTKIQSLALTALFKLVSKAGGKWNELQGAAPSTEKNKRSNIHCVLMMLSTFADWIGHHQVYLFAREPELWTSAVSNGNGIATTKETPVRTASTKAAAPPATTIAAGAMRMETETEEPQAHLPAVFMEDLGGKSTTQAIGAQDTPSASLFPSTGTRAGAASGRETTSAPAPPPSVPSRAMSEDMWIRLYRADRQDYRVEVRARSMMKTALSLMKEAMESKLQSTPFKSAEEVLDHIETGMLLREHAELRGYLPVSQSCERLFKRIDAIHNSVVWIPDPIARVYRMHSLLMFIKGTLARSIGARTTEETPVAAGLSTNTTSSAGRRGLLDLSATSGIAATTSSPEKDKGRERKDLRERKDKKSVKATEKEKKGGGGGGEKKGKALTSKRPGTAGEPMEVVDAIGAREKGAESLPVLSEEAFPVLPGTSSVSKGETSLLPAARPMYSEVVESMRGSSPSPPLADKAYGLWATAFVEEEDGPMSLSLGLSMSQGLNQTSSALSGGSSTSVPPSFADRVPWESSMLGSDDLEGETLVEDLLEDEEVVFKPAFIRQLPSTSSVLSVSAVGAIGGGSSGSGGGMTSVTGGSGMFRTASASPPPLPPSQSSMVASGSGGNLLGLYAPNREVADLLHSVNLTKDDANPWAALGLSTSSTIATAGTDLSLGGSHGTIQHPTDTSALSLGAAPLRAMQADSGGASALLWPDSLMDMFGSGGVSSLQEWGAPLLPPTSERGGGGAGPIVHPPGLFGPSLGRAPATDVSSTQASPPRAAPLSAMAPPPGLGGGVPAVRGPPKQAYLGMGGFQT